MLVPVEEFFEGGHSICRNRVLRKNEEVNRKGGRFGGEWEVLI